MSDTKRKPAPKFTTPIGTLGKFPKLREPDEYQGKKSYKCELLLTEEQAQPIIDRVDAELPAAREAFAEAKAKAVAEGRKKGKAPKINEETHLPYYPVIDEDGNETGMIAFKFKSQAEYVDKKTGETKTRRIAHFTASGKPIPHGEKPDLWGGSRVRLSYSVGAFGNTAAGTGVSLRLEAVKVIEAKQKGSGEDASRYGFDGDDEGYEGEEGSATDTGMGGDDSGATGDDGDDAPAF
jgi:hypothetical protein